MLTLFERVLFKGEINDEKISLHVIQSLMAELGVDRLTVAQCASIMALTEPQTNDFMRVLSAAYQSSNKAIFTQRVFAYLLLGENCHRAANNGLSGYLIEANFWAMIDSEAVK
jgi:hypothetical protein